MDRTFFTAETAATPLEFCDLFDRQGRIIHVKKRSASSTLSHLFAQGSVACETFLRDQRFREAVQDDLVAMHKPTHAGLIQITHPIAGNYPVVFAIITKDSTAWPPPLPFFSAVNLMHHVTRIQSMGFPVSLQYIRAT